MLSFLLFTLAGAEWNQFRGPNASGIGEAKGLPLEFGPGRNQVWRADLPPGKSSPVFAGGRIFLTGHDGDRLLTLAIDRASGRELWRREVTRARQEKRHKLNDPAAPTPVADARGVFAFFPDFGLVGYSPEGKELWRMALPAMPSMQGVAGSPILAGERLILVVDQAQDSYMMAVNPRNGELIWRQARRPAPGGAYTTPVLLNAGTFVTFSPFAIEAFETASGKPVWSAGGLPPQPKATPVVADGTVYALARSFYGDSLPAIAPFEVAVEQNDRNKDGFIGKEEAPEGPAKMYFGVVDRNKNGLVDAGEWAEMIEAASPASAVTAIRDGKVLWKHLRNIPDVASPLVYGQSVYMVQNGGILTALDARTGNVQKQGRLTGALGDYYASPVAAEGRIYLANNEGKLVVVKAGADWEVLAVNDLGDEVYATPALAEDGLYVRTGKALYRFGGGHEAVIRANCLGCHQGAAAQGGLDLATRESALKGGKSGPAFTPGNAEASLMISKMAAGLMPPGRRLDAASIEVVRQWIDAQKPERPAVTEADVTPMFQMRCVACHGKRKQEGGLDLRTQASRLKGGKSGPALVPGRPQESLIVKRIAAGEMPPPKMLFEAFVRPPTNPEFDTLKAWIEAGAPAAPPRQAAVDDITEKDRAWWAFERPKAVAPPAAGHPVDAFLKAKPAPASRRVLIRRAYLDLTGLVPPASEVDGFVNDARPDAYERLIDRLLESPGYGERWARFWLEAAGYADSEGIIDEDKLRPDAWRYRDYAIRAFNADKPYDRFLTEQLAGDELLDHRGLRNPTPEQLDVLAATGFLRMAPDGTYSPANGSVAERINVIADEIEVLSSSVLGLTIGCARCHDHKYDPIRQRDYYRLSAILQSALDPYDWVKPTERNLDVALAAERAIVEKHNAPVEAEIRKLEALPDQKKAVAEWKKKLKPLPAVRALYDMGGDPSPAYLLRRGDAQNLGEAVEPGTPSVLAKVVEPYRVQAPREGTSGRRLALARWLTQPGHPLTARVMVNRIWRHHFGTGLVASVANFGRTGVAPTNPELLDWLATGFERGGWSVKKMHRLMMTSAAYRAVGNPRRMDAEQLHDSILQVTGRLSRQQFGPPVEVETKPGGEVAAQGEKESFRRAIYVLHRRTAPVTLLEVFDLPPMSPNCTERPYSTVPAQALEMRNSPMILEHARYWAARLQDQYGGDRARQVTEVYRAALGRQPDAGEMARALGSLEKLTGHWQAHLEAQKSTAPRGATARWYALADFCHAMLNSAEFAYID